MLVRAKWLVSLDNSVAADQKLLAGSDQSPRRDRFFDPRKVLEVGQKVSILLVSRVDQEWDLTVA
jgi:hypothetical protein